MTYISTTIIIIKKNPDIWKKNFNLNLNLKNQLFDIKWLFKHWTSLIRLLKKILFIFFNSNTDPGSLFELRQFLVAKMMSDVHYLCFILLLQLFIFKVLFHSYCLFHGVIFGRDQPFNLSVIRLYEIHFILNLWLACKNSEGNFLKSWNLFVVLVLHYTATNLTAMHTIFWKGNTFFFILEILSLFLLLLKVRLSSNTSAGWVFPVFYNHDWSRRFLLLYRLYSFAHKTSFAHL